MAGADVIIMTDIASNITNTSIAEINRVGSIIMFAVAGMAGVLIASIFVHCLLKLKIAMGPRDRTMDLVRQIVFIS